MSSNNTDRAKSLGNAMELQGAAAALDQEEQGEIYEEYMKLLAGGRGSSRRSQTQSVTERKRQEQLNQIQ